MVNGKDTYRSMFDLYLEGYRRTSSSLRSKEENQKIEASLATFGDHCGRADSAVERGSGGTKGPSGENDIVALLMAGLGNIEAVFRLALEWDAMHVKRSPVLSQAALQKTARRQEGLDQELVANLKGLVSKVATDMNSGSGIPAPIVPAPPPSGSTIKKAVKRARAELAKETGDVTAEMVRDAADELGMDAPYDELVGE